MTLLLPILLAAGGGDAAAVTLEPSKVDRRWVPLEWKTDASPGVVTDAQGRTYAAQAEGGTLRWLVPHVPAGERMTFTLGGGKGKWDTVSLKETPGKYISFTGASGEITRYYFGPPHGGMHDKPFYYPWMVHGVNVSRSHPIEEREGESKDHPHHMSIYHTHGAVNGKDYWHKSPIKHKRVVLREEGPVFGRLVVEHQWGPSLTEVQDVRIYNIPGGDAIGDWHITLTANEEVVMGKTKEGGFAIRVTTGLTKKNVTLVDAKGNTGEPAIRADRAPWVNYDGTVDGKKVGVTLMNHPGSFRHPTTWHVRNYGCFSANPFFVAGDHKMAKGDSITIRFRLYGHGGDVKEGRVADVYAGYAETKLAVK